MPASRRPPLIHVGYHKTGTTWLQQRLFASHEVGFCTGSHRRDCLYVFVYPHAFEFDPAEARAFFEADWQRCPDDAVPVLSMERFSGTPHAGRYDSVEIAGRLHRTFPEGRVLVVVREQDDMILSSYRQYVKNSGGLSLDGYLHPPYEPSVIHQFSYGAFHYDRLVAMYDDLYGRENVLALPYEAFREDPVGTMEAISRFAGLDPDPEVLEQLRPSERKNASLSALATSLKRRANQVASRRSAINPTPLVQLSERGAALSKRFFYKIDGWLPRGLSRRIDGRERAVIRAGVGSRYEESNAALAERMGVDLGRYGYQMPEGWTLADGASPKRARPADATPTFHVLYTPGTVGLLSPFAESLVRHSPFRFRLVANGCGPEERAQLDALAATSPRLEALALPTDAPLSHGDAMDWLFARDDDPTFAFLDSDLFAVAPFGDPVREALAQGPTFFACTQPWSTDRDRAVFPGGPLAGRHLTTTGRYAGTTFFAVYERAAVERVQRAHGVGFGKYTWEELPASARGRLAETALRHSHYDTAKALNLLIRADGARLRYDPLPAIVHLGGVSDRVQGARRKAEGPEPWWNHPERVASAAAWGRLLRRAWRTATQSALPPTDGPSYKTRRRLAWHYFGDAIPALQAGQPPPPTPDFGDPLTQREMDRVARELARYYAAEPVRRAVSEPATVSEAPA